jgi:hypothetical protein
LSLGVENPTLRPATISTADIAHVDDLIEPRAKKILLPAIPPLLRPHHESPSVDLDVGKESQRRQRINLQENRAKHWPPLQKR